MGVPHLLFFLGPLVRARYRTAISNAVRQELNSVGNTRCRRSSVPDQAELDNRVGPFNQSSFKFDVACLPQVNVGC